MVDLGSATTSRVDVSLESLVGETGYSVAAAVARIESTVCKICPAAGTGCALLVDPVSAATSSAISSVTDQEDENGCVVVVAGLDGKRFAAAYGREDLSPVRPSVGLEGYTDPDHLPCLEFLSVVSGLGVCQ